MPFSPVILRGTSPAPQLFANALHAAYQLEWPIIDPDFAQHEDNAVWEKIRRDGKVSQAIDIRTAAVASKNWVIEPRGESPEEVKVSDILTELLEEISQFRQSRRFLAQAIFRASAYLDVISERKVMQLVDLPPMSWWYPKKLKHRDKRTVRRVPEIRTINGEEVVITFLEVLRVSDGNWIRLDQATKRLLVEIVYDDEQGKLGYGRGLLEALYFLWWAKNVVLKEGLQGVERWAQGFLLAKIDSDQVGAPGSADSESIRDKMLDTLEQQRSRHAAVVDKSDDISLVTGGGEGHEIVMGMLSYLDDLILSTALGSVLPFGGGEDKGSLARASIEEEISDELLEYDRGIVDEALTNSLIRLIMDHNRQNFAELGYADVRMPRFKTSHQKREDPLKNAQVVSTLRQAQIPLRKQDVYERVGFEMPSEGDEVFEPLEIGIGGGGLFGGPGNGNGAGPEKSGVASDR